MPLPSDTPLRPLGYSAWREKAILEEGPRGPWGARVKIVPVRGLAGGTRFSVEATWEGPPPVNTAPSAVPVQAEDTLLIEDLELARGVAIRALEVLAIGTVVPDLRALRDHLQRR